MTASWHITQKSVVLSTGTEFSILSKDPKGSTTILEMIRSGHGPVFALFPKDDVDFSVQINNHRSERGIKFSLTINKQSHSFCIDPNMEGTLETLESNGRKLHFRNQESSDGQVIVAQTAAKHGLSYNEAAEMCCKINFDIEVGEKVARAGIASRSYSDSMPRFRGESTTLSMASFRGGAELISKPIAGNIENESNEKVGARGVICYGEKSNQVFEKVPFITDKNFKIDPFVIELRMASRYAAI